MLALTIPVDAGLTGVWRFDGNHNDSVGSNNGTFVGAETYTTGYLNRAISLNGSNHLNLGSSALSTNAYTKSAWVRRTGTGNNNIISGHNSTGRHALLAATVYGYLLAAGHNGTWNSVIDNVAIPTGVWTHVAVTYDATLAGGTLKLYRNGRLTGGTPVATNIAPPTGATTWIGGFQAPGNGWVGQLDDARLYDHALTADEMYQLYQAGQHSHSVVYDRVPEMADYDIVYELPIANTSALGTNGTAAYAFDSSDSYRNGLSFDRVAYYVDVATNGALTSRWVCVSLNPFTTDAKKIGVPSIATKANFQQPVTNMTVHAGGSYVATGTNLRTGNIEFWGYNYSAGNAAGVPNASATLYDCGDSNSSPIGTYGSMQIHNHAVNGTTATQTLFAYNRWGYGGTSDLGIGNAPSGNPDWTFAQNANTYTSKVLLVLARPVPQVVLTRCPKPLQLYPRDLATGRANVTMAGHVLSGANCTQVTATVTRRGAAYTNVTQSLTYVGGKAPFTLVVPIVAELADYDFALKVTRNGGDYTVVTVNDVVAGDVFLINGQSNAEARKFNGSANGNQSTWVRSFGYRSSVAAEVQADLAWHLAEGDAVHAAGAVGQWGLRLGRLLADANGIPVCIINNAEGGRPISYFLRNDMDRANPTNNYGQLLYRVQQAGLANAVRALLWYQGESDGGNAAVHENGWLPLYQNWREDFPALEKVYVCQLHVGCGTTRELPDLRDRQRRFADRDPAIEVMSTTGLDGHDGCHYAYAGYAMLGEHLARVVRRDLYGVTAANIAPPNPAYAYFNGATKNEVRIEMRDTGDTLTWNSGAQVDFRLEGSTATPTNGYVTAHTAVLQFNQNVSAATGISYLAHTGAAAPGVKNAGGVGLVAFYNLPILAANPGGTPAVPTGLRAILVSGQRVDTAWTRMNGVVAYLIKRDGVILDRVTSDHFIDDNVQAGRTYFYQVAAVGNVATSAWSTAVMAQPRTHNVFSLVPETSDYDILYQLDLASDFQAGATLDLPYKINNSAIHAVGIQRAAYYLELQSQPGTAMRWVYVSLPAFTTQARLLGVPVVAKGATFQRKVTDLNIYSSAASGIVTGRHIATGNLEFWGYNYGVSNALAIPGASNSLFDFGDQATTGGTYGSMQIHNYAARQTLFAYNRWGSPVGDDIGIGNAASGHPDWTFTTNAPTWNVKRLYVLVLTDADADGLPDAWERLHFGSLHAAGGGPADDPDGDGFTNRQEHVAGTDPNDSRNVLSVAAPQRSGNDFIIRFPTEIARRYVVEYKNALTDTTWNPLATVEGTGGVLQVTDPGAAVRTHRFYHVRVVP
jgi:hypothetical protein